MKTKLNYTPGPWHISGTSGRDIREGKGIDGDMVAQIAMKPDYTIDHANARLIAAAPSLYEVLTDLVNAIEQDGGGMSYELIRKAKNVLNNI